METSDKYLLELDFLEFRGIPSPKNVAVEKREFHGVMVFAGHLLVTAKLPSLPSPSTLVCELVLLLMAARTNYLTSSVSRL